MIITITGYPGSGKSTLGRGIASALKMKHYSAGDFLREIAKEKGMGLLQILHAMEEDGSIDDEIDTRTARLGKQEDNFVIDGRMAWHFIPKSLKIFVKIDLKAAAERVYGDTRAGKKERSNESENKSLEITEKNMRERLELNRNAYKRLYNVDCLDEKNYDLIVDTSKSGIDETRERVLKQIIGIAKKWRCENNAKTKKEKLYKKQSHNHS